MPVPGISATLDTSIPNGARVYGVLAGTTPGFPADRDLAARLTDPAQGGCAALREAALVNRKFAQAAVRWTAAHGRIGQFISAGCGMPTTPAIHDIVRSAGEDPRVVYLDNDALVFELVAGLYRGPGIAVVCGDARDPARILASDPVLDMVLDLDHPVAVVMTCIAGHLGSPTEVRDIIGEWMQPLAPGSALILSTAVVADDALEARAVDALEAAGGWRNFRAGDVESFFGGLRVCGKIGDLSRWPLPGPGEGPVQMAGGVGFKEA